MFFIHNSNITGSICINTNLYSTGQVERSCIILYFTHHLDVIADLTLTARCLVSIDLPVCQLSFTPPRPKDDTSQLTIIFMLVLAECPDNKEVIEFFPLIGYHKP